MQSLFIYNTLSRKKEIFEPLNPPFVGLYVCGPTVYNHVHLGNLRTFTTFDLAYRYLQFLGYKVRYVRNITDVGHLENEEAGSGEDKIAKKARLEQLEPMEIVQFYTEDFHKVLSQFNILSPSIEPTASGHIIEQITMIEKIIENGYAYEVNGSVYFDVLKYNNEKKEYGILSGRIIDELFENTRENLEGQEEKRNSVDFALWKKASPEHIMRWPSPWGIGFPGWHLECSAMSTKYLGETFDIHGGGMDLKFPHHEAEIAQNVACTGHHPAKVWMHGNMLTVNGQKMSKSFGNFITPVQLLAGDHQLLTRAHSPMTIRFFILQAHYRSTLDFSNEALDAARKAYKKIINGLRSLKQLNHREDAALFDEKINKEINTYCEGCYKGMNDDFNSAVTIANLFNLVKYINSFKNDTLNLSVLNSATFENLYNTYTSFVERVLGLHEEKPKEMEPLLETLLDIYRKAKQQKDYETVDMIRAKIKGEGIVINDTKKGITWSYEE
jgi:cysteinyl-tRNA synthetase